MNFEEFLRLLKQKLELLDLYGQMPTLRILGQAKFSTPLGIFFSFLTIMITIIYLIAGMLELTSRASPTILQTDRQIIETSKFPLQINNFTLAITVADLNQQPLQTLNKYFSISIENCHFHRKLNQSTGIVSIQKTCQHYPLEPCNSKHFVTETQKNYFSNIRLGAVQCINKQVWEENPPVLQGIKSGIDYSQLTVTFSMCENKTSNNTCASNEEIIQNLKTGYYVVHMSDSLIQTLNTDQLTQDIIQLQYTSFSITSSKTLYQGMKIINTITDQGLAFSDNFLTEGLIQSMYRESTDFYNSEFLIQHNIIIDNKSTQYERTYVKVWQVLSRVGGLYQMLWIVVISLIKPLVQIFMQISLSNELFYFENKQKNNLKNKNQVVVALESALKISQVQNDDEFYAKQCNVQQLEQFWKKKHKKIKSNFTSILSLLCGCNKRTKMQLQKAERLFMQKIDIANIMQKLFEIDKLKFILLTNDQRNLFDCLPKPSVKDEEQDFDYSVLKYSYYQNQKIEMNPSAFVLNAYESFKNIISQNQKSTTDKAILNCLDEDIKTLFQNVYKNSSIKKESSMLFQNSSSKSNPQIYFDIVEESISKEGSPKIMNESPQRIFS